MFFGSFEKKTGCPIGQPVSQPVSKAATAVWAAPGAGPATSPGGLPSSPAAPSHSCGTGPVSYTHLDVYKRQIQEIIAQDSTLTFASLAPLSVNEIALITESRHLTSQTVTQTGTASTKAYITAEAAKNAALSHAGISESDVAQLEIEFDSEDGLMVYEVEFYAGGTEYDYDINARTGEVDVYKRQAVYRGAWSASRGQLWFSMMWTFRWL